MSKNRHHRQPPIEGRDAPACGLVILPPDADAEALRAAFAPAPRYGREFVTGATVLDVLNERAASGWRVVQMLPARRNVAGVWADGWDALLERV
jgi:hypothetical protein